MCFKMERISQAQTGGILGSVRELQQTSSMFLSHIIIAIP